MRMCQPIRLFIAECACYSLVFYTNHCDFECGAIVDWMCYLIHSTRTITTANQKSSHPTRHICKHHSPQYVSDIMNWAMHWWAYIVLLSPIYQFSSIFFTKFAMLPCRFLSSNRFTCPLIFIPSPTLYTCTDFSSSDYCAKENPAGKRNWIEVCHFCNAFIAATVLLG